MTPHAPNLPIPAVRQAARRFGRALAGQAMLGRIARVEATLYADAVDSLSLVDEALLAGWRQSAGEPPRHEVIWWRGQAPGADGLRLCAYDVAGRVLLRRTYPVDACERKGGSDA